MRRFEAALQTLELDQNASGEEIKQAYKDLVLVWHPDRFSHNPRLQQKAEAKLKLFNQAYEHLKGWQQAPPATPQAGDPPGSPFGHRQASSSSRPPPRQGCHAGHRPPPRTKHRPPHAAHTSSPRQSHGANPRSPQSAHPRSARRPRQARRHPSHRSRARVSWVRRGSAWISLAEAKLILKRYHFQRLNPADQPHSRYQAGPFVLVTCEAPPEVMISVPCDSLQRFDRILLSIPCKSMGHFIRQEAMQLLTLLHAQTGAGDPTQK